MKNEALQQLEGLVGEWKLTMTDAWFLDDPSVQVEGSATVRWLGDAFVEVHWVIGRSDARDQLVMLYHDERGVSRIFDMTYSDGEWTLIRLDPDFHQRFIATMQADRIDGRWEASEDAGATWRKDFDLIFERRS
jgi:hypothetical protein